jgi:hypothetical protein
MTKRRLIQIAILAPSALLAFGLLLFLLEQHDRSIVTAELETVKAKFRRIKEGTTLAEADEIMGMKAITMPSKSGWMMTENGMVEVNWFTWTVSDRWSCAVWVHDKRVVAEGAWLENPAPETFLKRFRRTLGL